MNIIPHSVKITILVIISLILEYLAYSLLHYAIDIHVIYWKFCLFLLAGALSLTPLFYVFRCLWLLWIIIPVFLVGSLLFSLIGFPIAIYHTNKCIGELVFALIALTGMTYAASALFIYKSNFHNIKIILRTISIAILLLCDFVMLTFSLNDTIFYVWNDGFFAAYESDVNMVCVGSFKIWFWITIFILFFALKKHKFRKPSNDNILLFLRSFKYDKSLNNEKLLKILVNNITEEYGYQILRIGNPNTFGFCSTCDTYFLSSSNWQKEVSPLIRKAAIVFVVISPTSGVLWEIYNHQDEINKYIFYVPQVKEIGIIIEMPELLQPHIVDCIITIFLKFLQSMATNHKECLFYCYNGRVFYLLSDELTDKQVQQIVYFRKEGMSFSNEGIFIDITGIVSTLSVQPQSFGADYLKV